ncbi:hypothetical protein CYMTET_15121 [Cymbomonas tetramitiformis]|uniref:Uncharacterized protein n=1 Tax=Cymbomonas tetramitiformis TaxID=36881 RepID=A0AAE0GF51_9CHLO|nr:hypothetical protein CYMTET_15121 [Cymbomonas tetramitiformis]
MNTGSPISEKKKYDRPENGVASKNTAKMRQAGSGITGSIENLQRNLKALDEDIKKDNEGKKEYEDQIARLSRRKATLEARVAENKAWADTYDSDIGPFQDRYDALVKEIHHLYADATVRHKVAIELLMKEFQYHPIFKRWNDDFSSTPFKPAAA